ncbi:MAG: hypothetical protein BMS9Abin23_0073 [Thermodesulfobacteriota bacterium]|nr:MAG: hypothetical protein BMS9Abin23_0073 [Thermodesulfobacteriota bacterium]
MVKVISGKYALSVTSVLLMLLLLSCSSEDKGVQGKKGEGAGPGPGSLSVTIVPDEPTVESRLKAVISGDADKATYRWEVNGRPLAGASEDTLRTAGLKKGDEVMVKVSTEDEISTAGVIIKDSAPSVRGVSLDPDIIYRGVDVTAVVKGYDPDGDPLKYDYRWFINGEELIMENGPVLNGDLYRRGDKITLEVIPFDGEIRGEAFVSLPVVIPDAPPRFTSVPPAGFKARSYSYRVMAEDPDGDALSFSLKKAPDGMTIDKDGLITWAIKAGDGGTHEVEVVAEDGFGAKATQSYEIAIEIP